jgi:starch synthase (maltosyl-transferring)
MPSKTTPRKTTPATAQFGRIGILNATPLTEAGCYPARVEIGEHFTATAQVFIEGRAQVGATAVLRTPSGRVVSRTPMHCTNPGLDYFEVDLHAGAPSATMPWEAEYPQLAQQLGKWSLAIEGWEDVYDFWFHDARIKVEVDDDVDNILEEGAGILSQWAHATDAKLTAEESALLISAAARLADTRLTAHQRLTAGDAPVLHTLARSKPFRVGITSSRRLPLKVERPHASFTAWYQFFPRSEGAYYDAPSRDEG